MFLRVKYWQFKPVMTYTKSRPEMTHRALEIQISPEQTNTPQEAVHSINLQCHFYCISLSNPEKLFYLLTRHFAKLR